MKPRAHGRAVPLVVLLLSLCAPLARAGEPQLPDWMTDAAASTGHWGDARAVFLLEDTLVTVAPNGKATERYRAVVKILRPEGREVATPFVSFTKDRKLESFHVWSIGADGHHYAMKDNEYVEMGNPDWGVLYDDERAKIASPPGADPGAIIAWEFTRELPSYFTEDTWGFQNDVPTVRSVFEIDLPPGWHQEAVWARHDPLPPVQVAPGHFRWEQNDIPGISLSGVPLHPDWNALAGRMTVHFSPNPLPQGDALWSQIGNWYYSLAAPRSEGGSDIATQARGLVAPGDDFMARLQKVASYMQQQIRYVAIEIGIGGWQPHSAEDVFRSQYGDCKDKATLTIAMLDAVGIRATWLSVDDRRGVIDPTMPTLFGDHMIVAIEIPPGYNDPRLQAVVTTSSGRRYLIFDPTNTFVPVGQIPNYEQGSYGVLAAGSESQLLHLPVLDPNVEATQRTATFSLSPDGTLNGDVTVLRTGANADDLRHALSMNSQKDQRQQMERSLQSDFSAFTLGSESVRNLSALEKPLELQYQVTAPMYAKPAGSLLLLRPRVIGSLAYGLPEKTRKYPISFDGVGTWTDSFDVKIPPGYTVDDVPDPVNMDVGFASYRSQVKAEGNVLHYQREYVLKQVTLPASDYPDLLRLEAAITTDENSDAVLKKQ